jgi:hypothetical protein
MRPLGAGLLGHPTVAPREREIVIHRTCARAGADYEWGVHAVAFAPAVGLSDEQIVATAVGEADDPAWSERDALLVRLADELHDSATVSDELWGALAGREVGVEQAVVRLRVDWVVALVEGLVEVGRADAVRVVLEDGFAACRRRRCARRSSLSPLSAAAFRRS